MSIPARLDDRALLTRNDPTEAQRTQSDSNEKTAKSTKPILSLPLGAAGVQEAIYSLLIDAGRLRLRERAAFVDMPIVREREAVEFPRIRRTNATLIFKNADT